MIGKVGLDTANSVIGMISAKSGTMESSPLNSDFKSLLRSSGDLSSARSGDKTFDLSELENGEFGDAEALSVQSWDPTAALPIINQSFGSTIFQRQHSAGAIEQNEQADVPLDLSGTGNDLSLTFNRDAMIEPEGPQVTRLDHAHGDPASHPAAALSRSGILAAQPGLTLGQGSKFDRSINAALPGSADAQAAGDAAPKQPGVPRLMSAIPVALGDPDAPPAELPSLAGDASDGDTGKLTAAPSSLMTPEGMPRERRSELSQFGFASSSREPAPIGTADALKSALVDSEPTDTAKPELKLASSRLETAFDPQALAPSAAPAAAREAGQKPVSFDLSSPRIAERLAAEIADISGTDGKRTFEINPRNLGRMEIVFTTRGAADIVQIQTDHRAAKDIIVQHSQQLQDILKSQGREDLTFRVDVKDTMLSASSRNDGGTLFQQDHRDGPAQQGRPSRHGPNSASPDGPVEQGPVSDNSRYA